MIDLKTLSRGEIGDLFQKMGLPEFRVSQLIHWMYEKNAASIDDITEFSKPLRETLKGFSYIGSVKILKKTTSPDGTIKLLFGLEDGLSVEGVLIPDEYRLTLCVSSQVGCAMGCRFCLTATMGLVRNLRADEIAGQITAVRRELQAQGGISGGEITNIVFMGMGEPLRNFDGVVRGIHILTEFMGISKRRITLSTAGVVPELQRLYREIPEVNLAVSLNATTDETRSALMPVNNKYNIGALLRACGRLPISSRRRITFGYVLLKGINDTPADARRLIALLKGLSAKVNLIPFNTYDAAKFEPPDEQTVLEFQQILIDRHVTAFIRKSMGREIYAACGQLKTCHETASP
ncbi:23S rRNA (adenine(2503)-C(2))-methyltransferase RlmN [Candidatus Magnetominusculus dajiuhuensis]|uniref:23S rRNA (adenine(2503)-C(2))-methyltransferase RlmN n=1 Tax=Candidatus Magnetominusculus dajiuhuensis TaxID=3137712 RepID=UPI003B42EB71